MTPDLQDALHHVGTSVSFIDGALLREKGAFAPDLLLITSGHVACILTEEATDHLTVGPGTIVGEIGFLTGQGATATLRAQGPVEALSLDARALQRLRRDRPTVAADVLRHLAHLLQERMAQNEGLVGHGPVQGVIRCSTLDQQRTAQRVRFDVERLENGQPSKFADPEEGIITDDLDASGTSFLAVDGVQAIGMMRVNASADGIAEITATAIRDTYWSKALLGDFFQAISTFARASGIHTLAAACTSEEEPIYAAHGFEKTATPSRLVLTLCHET